MIEILQRSCDIDRSLWTAKPPVPHFCFNIFLRGPVCSEIFARGVGFREMAEKVVFQDPQERLTDDRTECFEQHLHSSQLPLPEINPSA